MNKNDCLDCANSISWVGDWLCSKRHIIPTDEDGVVHVLDDDCEDFEYQE